MKNIFKSKLALIGIFSMLFATSCEDYLGDGINENPNSPTSVPITVILPAAQVFTADITGGDFSRFASVIVQQTEGVARQWVSINNYSSMNPATFNVAWNNMYENILVELDLVKTVSAEAGYGNYEGVANVLIAYNLMMATDVWDDIPYSEALLGIENIAPQFDTQAAIYTEINTLLTSAVTLLQGGDGGLSVGSEDVIYGGDMGLWAKAANSLLARMHLHQGNYAAALTAAAGGFAAEVDGMAYSYTDNTNAAQWYRFNRDRTGDIEFHPTMRGIMTGLNDTDRLAMFDQTFITTHPYLTAAFDQELISYRELKFIEAEALLASGGSAAAIRDAYLAGVQSSFNHLGLDAAMYTAYVGQASVDPGVGNVTLEQIITQKYIGIFTHPELFSDWRRTGFPALSPTSGSAVPVRFPYGSDEILFNSNAPQEQEINIFSDKVGWDR